MKSEKIIEILEGIVKRELVRKYKTVEADELLAEAFLWLSMPGRLERIQKKVEETGGTYEQNQGLVANYIRKSLPRLFHRLNTNEIIRRSEVISSHYSPGDEGHGGDIFDFEKNEERTTSLPPFSKFEENLTPQAAADLLADYSISQRLTKLQAEAIKLVFIDGLPATEAAKVAGATISSFHHRKNTGLKAAYIQMMYSERASL